MFTEVTEMLQEYLNQIIQWFLSRLDKDKTTSPSIDSDYWLITMPFYGQYAFLSVVMEAKPQL